MLAAEVKDTHLPETLIPSFSVQIVQDPFINYKDIDFQQYDIPISKENYLQAIDCLSKIFSGEKLECFQKLNIQQYLESAQSQKEVLDESSFPTHEEEILCIRALRFMEFFLNPKEGDIKLIKDEQYRQDKNVKFPAKLPFFEPEENKLFLSLLNTKVGLKEFSNIDKLEGKNLYKLLEKGHLKEEEINRYRKGAQEVIENLKNFIEFSYIRLISSITIEKAKNWDAEEVIPDAFSETFSSIRRDFFRKFNHTLGFRITTYMSTWAGQKAGQCIAKAIFPVHVPTPAIDDFNKMHRLIQQETKYGGDLKIGEIASLLEIHHFTKEQIDGFLRATGKTSFSLDAPMDNSSIKDWNEIIPSKNKSIEEFMEEKDFRQFIRSSILHSNLDEKEAASVYIRFFLLNNDNQKETLSQVGSIMGNLTSERIRQLNNSAFIKMKRYIEESDPFSKKENYPEKLINTERAKAKIINFQNEEDLRNWIMLKHWVPYSIKESLFENNKKTILTQNTYPIIEMYYGLGNKKPMHIEEIASSLKTRKGKVMRKLIRIQKILDKNKMSDTVISPQITYFAYLEKMRQKRILTQN